MTEKTLKEGGQTEAKFLVFLNFWLNTAEKLMVEGQSVEVSTTNPDGSIEGVIASVTPANAIRKALELAEQHLGFIDVHFLGQLLVCIGMYWEHGDTAMSEFSTIELKICGEALMRKIHDQQIQAAEGDDDDGQTDQGADQGHPPRHADHDQLLGEPQEPQPDHAGDESG